MMILLKKERLPVLLGRKTRRPADDGEDRFVSGSKNVDSFLMAH